jgi:hypothetical protein
MKKLILLLTLAAFSVSSFSQTRNNDEWFLSFGVNAINSLGSRSPIYHPEDWSFQFPISAAAEYKWNNDFSVEQAITFNGFTESNEIDGADLKDDYNYLSFDTHLKYYFGKHIFPNTDWLDFYANAGVGFFHIDKTNISANLGGGVLFWLNQSKSFGLRAQTIGKFAFNHPDSGFDNNHFQYHLQAIFKL